MSRATPQMRALAARLIAGETPAKTSPVGFPVCEKLRPQLSNLMGRGGHYALLARALTISRAEVDWLQAVAVNEDGTLATSEEAMKKVNAKELEEGNVVLIVHLLGLLVAFIGDNLTLRLVRDLWPKLRLDD